MFATFIDQMKAYQSGLVALISDKFTVQLRELHDENSELRGKLTMLEERLAASQIRMLTMEEHNQCSFPLQTTGTDFQEVKQIPHNSKPNADFSVVLKQIGNTQQTSLVPSQPSLTNVAGRHLPVQSRATSVKLFVNCTGLKIASLQRLCLLRKERFL